MQASSVSSFAGQFTFVSGHIRCATLYTEISSFYKSMVIGYSGMQASSVSSFAEQFTLVPGHIKHSRCVALYTELNSFYKSRNYCCMWR